MSHGTNLFDDDVLVLVVIGGMAAYLLYKGTIGQDWNDATGRTALSNAGASVKESTLPNDKGASFVTIGDTNFRFAQGDFSKLNVAQRILITLDKIVPGTWLSKAVLT